MKISRKMVVSIASGLALIGWATVTQAQIPYIEGNWKFNAQASHDAGPAPLTHARTYRLRDDGFLVGIAVMVDASGSTFLQFAAKPDGKDYPEFDNQASAQYLVDKTSPPRTYSESATADDHRIKWVDKMDGRVLFSGERWVSKDGNTMSFTVDTIDQNGKAIQPLYVFDRTGK